MKQGYNLILLMGFFILLSFSSNAQAPAWEWAKTTGEQHSLNYAKDVTVDSQGNVYSIGYFSSSTITFGGVNLTKVGSNPNIYVTKYSATGSLIWAKNFGGANDYENSCSITTDGEGSVYITGSLRNVSNIDGVMVGPVQGTNRTIFVAKFNSSGNVLWAIDSAETIPNIESRSIAVDSAGNVYITGYYGPGDLTFGTAILSTSSNRDLFLAKFNSQGATVWEKNAATTTSVVPNDMAIGANDQIYIVGHYATAFTLGLFNLPPTPARNVFVASYNTEGIVNWATAPSPPTGGSHHREGHSIAIGGEDEVIIAGSFNAPMTFGNITVNHNAVLTEDIFVAKLTSAGEMLDAVSAGGNTYDEAYDVQADDMGNIYISGYFKAQVLILEPRL